MISQRYVPDGTESEFRTAYETSVAHMMTLPGVKAVSYSMDKENPNMLHDIQWFNDINGFLAHIDMSNPATEKAMMDWVSKYDKIPFTGDVFGGWNKQVVDATKGKGAQFDMRKSQAGFIRQNTGGLEGPPVIITTKRTVKAGKMKELIAATQALADDMRMN